MNLYQYPEPNEHEMFDTLLSQGNVSIERIVSCGQTTPKDKPYIQAQNEWVIVLQGEARIKIEDNEEILLEKGAHLFIPKNAKHWVTFTSTNPPVLWLAVHFKD
ncbi:cupin domain-containing protein [Fangia hongkongensis]|uniref:cupin domain-containing protein n=1 Tax=Fangia hongkongensis TaxID=270495 RepID=UPI000367C471|nr:cupin domain-containing protein [Fangia hongkongensis]MBK2124195.1 cupin domain-containing protein [Fangia hongkongensis]